MKNRVLNYSLLFFVLLLMTAACKNAEKDKLKKDIEATNRSLPMQVYDLGVMEKIKYDEDANEVTMNFTITDDMIAQVMNKATQELVEQRVSILLRARDMQTVAKEIADADATLIVNYNSQYGKKSAKFSASELKKLLKSPVSSSEKSTKLLEIELKAAKQMLPFEIEDGIALTDVYEEGNSIVYECSISNPDVDFTLIKENTEEIRKEILNDIKNDPSMKVIREAIKDLNKNLVYRYVDVLSGKSLDLVLTSKEL